MEEKRNRAFLRPEEWGGQRFIYEEDGESCYYYDKECIEEKRENNKKEESLKRGKSKERKSQ